MLTWTKIKYWHPRKKIGRDFNILEDRGVLVLDG